MIIGYILRIFEFTLYTTISPFLVRGWGSSSRKKIYSLSLTLALLDCHSLWQGKERSAATFYDKNSILSYVF